MRTPPYILTPASFNSISLSRPIVMGTTTRIPSPNEDRTPAACNHSCGCLLTEKEADRRELTAQSHCHLVRTAGGRSRARCQRCGCWMCRATTFLELCRADGAFPGSPSLSPQVSRSHTSHCHCTSATPQFNCSFDNTEHRLNSCILPTVICTLP